MKPKVWAVRDLRSWTYRAICAKCGWCPGCNGEWPSHAAPSHADAVTAANAHARSYTHRVRIPVRKYGS